jgi:hypothetical protein
MKSKSAEPETHNPSPHEVLGYSHNTEASLDGDEGRVEGVGEINHGAAEEQFTRTHSQPDLEGKGEAPSRSVKNQSQATEGRHVSSKPGLDVAAERKRANEANRKAVEAAHEKGTTRTRGREWAATVK